MRVFVSPLYTGSSRYSASSSSCILGRFLVLFLHFFLEMASESLETFLTFGASSGVLFFFGSGWVGSLHWESTHRCLLVLRWHKHG